MDTENRTEWWAIEYVGGHRMAVAWYSHSREETERWIAEHQDEWPRELHLIKMTWKDSGPQT